MRNIKIVRKSGAKRFYKNIGFKTARIAACLISLLMLCVSVSAQHSANDFFPDLGLGAADYSLPEDVGDTLGENGITPDSIDGDALQLENVFSYIISTVYEKLKKPLAFMGSMLAVVLFCAAANTLCESTGMSKLFTVISALAGAAAVTSCVMDSISETGKTLECGGTFIASFFPAFAGVMAVSGKPTAAAVLNAVIMGGAQVYTQLAVKVMLPVCACIMGVTLSGAANAELRLDSIGGAVKKVIIWVLGLSMTVFVGLLGVQSFITLPADNVGIKTARFTAANAIPFVGGAISDAMSVMMGGIGVIRGNFGSFGIIAGALIMLPPIISAICCKLVLALCRAAGELFGLSALGAVFKSAEDIISICIALMAGLLLMTVIVLSIILMSF